MSAYRPYAIILYVNISHVYIIFCKLILSAMRAWTMLYSYSDLSKVPNLTVSRRSISHSHQLKTISMHIYSGRATSRRSQGGRFLHYSNPVTTELKCFHYSFKPPGESRYDKLGSAYYVLNRD